MFVLVWKLAAVFCASLATGNFDMFYLVIVIGMVSKI